MSLILSTPPVEAELLELLETSVSSLPETHDDTHILSLCRRNPTWRDIPDINWEICTQAMGWKRRSRFWEGTNNRTIYTGDDMNEEMEATLHQCVKDNLTQSNGNGEPSWDILTTPSVVNMQPAVNEESHEQHYAPTPLVVEVASALNEYEVNALQAVESCVRQHLEARQYEARSFGELGGGNDCTYMSAFLQILAPGVVAQIQSVAHVAWQAAGWNTTIISDRNDDDESAPTSQYPDPRSLGLRTTEVLSYKTWKHLATHLDTESIFTIVVALSDPDTSYGGGEFYIDASESEHFTFRPNRLSAVVFVSETPHGLQEISGGLRETFATELWIRDDVTFGIKRPTIRIWSKILRDFKDRGLFDDIDESELIGADEEEPANNEYGSTNTDEKNVAEHDSTDSENESGKCDVGQDELNESEKEYEDENSDVERAGTLIIQNVVRRDFLF